MEIQRFPGELYGENTYLVLEEESKVCILIDPGCMRVRIPQGYTLDKILLTHAHVDHMLCAQQYAERFCAPIYVCEADLGLYESDSHSLFSQAGFPREKILPPVTFRAGEAIPFGALEITVIPTPGHTPGSVCYRLGEALFTGDTLMRGTIGRTDLPGGSDSAMESTCRMLADFPEDLAIYPGHGEASALSREQRTNPYLRGAL